MWIEGAHPRDCHSLRGPIKELIATMELMWVGGIGGVGPLDFAWIMSAKTAGLVNW